jgi:hypothetical protein
MKQIDKRILQAGIAHIEMFVVGIVALGLVGVLGFVGYNAWQNSNGEKQADAGTSGFVSSPGFCNSLGRALDTKPDAKKIVSNKWKIDNGWGLCKKACKHGDHKLVSGNPYDKCVKKSNNNQAAVAQDKKASTKEASTKKCPSGYDRIDPTKTGKNCRSKEGMAASCDNGGQIDTKEDKCVVTKNYKYKPKCMYKDHAYSPTKNDCRKYKKV